MISYQTTTPGAALVEVEAETPQPQGTEVLVKTVACGVCHSDIHIHEGVFELGAGKQLEVGRKGQVLGHEIFGEVVAVGPDAEDVSVGDRRVVFHGLVATNALPVAAERSNFVRQDELLAL